MMAKRRVRGAMANCVMETLEVRVFLSGTTTLGGILGTGGLRGDLADIAGEWRG